MNSKLIKALTLHVEFLNINNGLKMWNCWLAQRWKINFV